MTQKKDAALVLRESQAIIGAQDLLRTPVDDLTADAQVTAWSILDLIEKELVGPRKKMLRAALLALVEAEGELKGKSKALELEGAKVTKQVRAGKVKYNVDALRAWISAKGIPEVNVLNVAYTVNEKAVEGLVAAGLMTEADLVQFTEVGKEVEALVVKKAPKVLALLPKE